MIQNLDHGLLNLNMVFVEIIGDMPHNFFTANHCMSAEDTIFSSFLKQHFGLEVAFSKSGKLLIQEWLVCFHDWENGLIQPDVHSHLVCCMSK